MPSPNTVVQTIEMKKLLPVFGFFLCVLVGTSQTLTLSDTTFKAGGILTSRNMLFDFDKATFRPETYPYLDSIIVFLLKNKGLVIEVGNHVDTRWTPIYSSCLSCNRAKAIVEYFISKGIPPTRMISKGYNDSKPLIPESQINKMKSKEEVEKAHQVNRRTEFKILQTDHK